MSSTKKFSALLEFGNTQVSVKCETIKQNGGVKFYGDKELSQDELVVVATVSSMLRKLQCKMPLAYTFNPEKERDMSRVVLCRWDSAGKLKLPKGYNPSRRYQHAATVKDAIARKKSFTCELRLFYQLPAQKQKKGSDG